MTFKNRFDKDNGIVFVRVLGEITIEDLMQNEMKILQHPDYRASFNMFLDMSLAKPHPSVDLGKVIISKEFVASLQEDIGNCKWAVYAPDDTPYAFSQMFEVISSGLTVETKVFRESKDAMRWLQQCGQCT